MTRLWAITCYFNPVGYQRRLQNYNTFRRNLNVPLVTVELAYRDGFELPADAADVLIRLRGGHVLWQKERLLNLALEALPANCNAVAWLDCDIVFEDDDWADRASRALDRYPMLQPFERVYEPSAEGWDGARRIAVDARPGYSVAHLLARGEVTPEFLRGIIRVNQRGTAGLAWVARREVLDRDGFYDACVMGSGNRAMLGGALGKPADAIHFLRMGPRWAEHYLAWAERHAERVGADIGCVEGSLIHLWHGDLEHRRYQDRHCDFSAYGYDPSTDVTLDDSGCWRWNSEKREMHAFVAQYFRERREDGVGDEHRRAQSVGTGA
jgi:hypothetical protein